MRVVNVAGYRDTGKTTLVEGLVPLLAADGQVATVKSLHHEVEIDTPGKDTHRHREAGAATVVGVTPSMTFEIRTRGKDQGVSVEDVLSDLSAEGYEYVVVEGFKGSDLPSIVVGDIHDADVGGTIIHRVEEVDSVDLEGLRQLIRELPTWK